MNSVLVLSSRPRFGQGIENLLREDVRFKIAGVETDRDKAIQHVQELQSDVILLDCSDSASDTTLPEMRIMKEGRGARIIGLNLQDNTMWVFCGEQRWVKTKDDLVVAMTGGALPG